MAEALREELAELAASVRAFLEWHAITGSDGLPGDALSPGEVHLGEPSAGPFAAPSPAGPSSPEAAAPSFRGAGVGAPQPHAEPRGASPSYAEPRGASPSYAEPRGTPQPHAEPRGAPQPAWAPPRSPEPPSRPAQGAIARAGAAAGPRAGAGPREDAAPEERVARLAMLAEEVRSCVKCPLHTGRTQTVFSRGNPFSELVFVGEGPGAEEDLQGEPFVGPAGQLLDRMIAAMGYRRDEVYICNIVKCRPPNNRKPEPHEMASCSPYLVAQLEAIKPKVIVALGATAVQGLIGTTTGITKLRGTWKLYKGSIPIMPTFHPAYLLRQPGAKREVWSDLKEVMRHLGKSVPDKG